MRRNFIVLRRSRHFNRTIGVDIAVAEEIFQFLGSSRKYKEKIGYLFHRILEHRNIYFDNYKRIKTFQRVHISEIRIFPNGDNGRIYCCEVNNKNNLQHIIMAKLLIKKKDREITKKIEQQLEALKNYQYEEAKSGYDQSQI